MCAPDPPGCCPKDWITPGYPYPEPGNEDYLEWIDLLESVVEASGSYTMIDLGAGYGRWAVRAVFAARAFDPKMSCHVTAVEGEPVMFEWMKQHFRDNGIDARKHRLIHGAISDEPKQVSFFIGGPIGGPFDLPLYAWFGQRVAKGHHLVGDSKRGKKYHGYRERVHSSGWRTIEIPSVNLRRLLWERERVDLIDLDIEGQEFIALLDAAEELDAVVKRVHIGTHGPEIEANLRKLFAAHGWECRADYCIDSTTQTPWGTIHFENGVQTWVNPRLK